VGEIWIDVPVAAARLAARGVQARELAASSRQCCTATGLRRAAELQERERQDAVVLRAWFRRHHGYYLRAIDRSGKTLRAAAREPAIQAWWMWGGDSMYRAAEAAVERAAR
jgi:hypothetical protein